MNVSFSTETETMTFSNVNKESAELFMDALVRFCNITIKNKTTDPATTTEEKEKLKYDRTSAMKMYRKIESSYTDNFKNVEVDAKEYSEEVHR